MVQTPATQAVWYTNVPWVATDFITCKFVLRKENLSVPNLAIVQVFSGE